MIRNTKDYWGRREIALEIKLYVQTKKVGRVGKNMGVEIFCRSPW